MKKGLSFVMVYVMLLSLLSFNPTPAYATTYYYVSVDGSDSNAGTSKSAPFESLTKALSEASAGTTIFLMNGTYYYTSTFKLSEDGTSSAPIKILNYSGHSPVVDFSGMSESSSNRGFQISGDYWIIAGLTIQNAGDNGIHISGDHNRVQDCTITGCHDTGLQISNGGSYNWINRVTSTYNYDSGTNGENADGFAAKLGVGPGNYFTECYAYYNSDDGFDLYQAENAVEIYDSEASYNGLYDGNGQGFKVGGDYTADNHYLENCTAIGNRSRGFDQNNNTGAITLIDCTGISNDVNFYFPTAPASGSHYFSGCVSTDGDDEDVIVGATVVNCSFNE